MTENDVNVDQNTENKQEDKLSTSSSLLVRSTLRQRLVWTWAMPLFALAFILSLWSIVTPLHRQGIPTPLLGLPTNGVLSAVGAWLPNDLHLTANRHDSFISSNNLEFLLLIALACVIYGLCALFLYRRPALCTHKRTLLCICLGAIVVGLVFILTPAMPSHDVFVYAGYGRDIVAHQANPYFVPLSAFKTDPLIPFDDWKTAVSAYGPVWLIVCALFAQVLGTQVLAYIIGFRLLAFACHLLNIWLVHKTLRTLGRSQHIVMLGTLLYAWNPLALLESSLGGHNDIFLTTLILLGILLTVQGEQRSFTRLKDYLLPVVAFTVATLVKFTTGPIIIFFLILLAHKTFYRNQAVPNGSSGRRAFSFQWSFLRPVLKPVFLTGLVGSLLVLGIYAPFWIGHSLHDIVNSFAAPPSSRLSQNSILRAILEWIKIYGLSTPGSLTHKLLTVFSNHTVWNIIDIVAVGAGMIAGAFWLWSNPTTRTMVLATLATLGIFLVVTPWFFPWYVIELVGLFVVCIPIAHDRLGRAVVAFAVTFSITGFFPYLFSSRPPIGGWIGLRCLTTIGPPLLAFLIFLYFKVKKEDTLSIDNTPLENTELSAGIQTHLA